MQFTCTKCQEAKPQSDYYFWSDGRRRPSCKTCSKKQMLEHYHKNLKNNSAYKQRVAVTGLQWYVKNRERVTAERNAKRRKAREHCLGHYGPHCACCGESKYEFLSMDHINGGGRKHRAEAAAHDICTWLIKAGFPSGFRVLCHNCNQSLGLYGYCPHQPKTSI